MTDMPVRVPLSQSNGCGFALVDECDAERVLARNWKLARRSHTNYAQATGGDRVLLHRFVIVVPAGMQVDHRDGDGLNNCRDNLRVCTASENCANKPSMGGTSRFKGVHWCKRSSRWRADIHKDRKSYFIGTYDSEEDAARAYDEAAVRLFKEFAKTNFPEPSHAS